MRLFIAAGFQSVLTSACPWQNVVVDVSSCPVAWARRMTEAMRSCYAS